MCLKITIKATLTKDRPALCKQTTILVKTLIKRIELTVEEGSEHLENVKQVTYNRWQSTAFYGI